MENEDFTNKFDVMVAQARSELAKEAQEIFEKNPDSVRKIDGEYFISVNYLPYLDTGILDVQRSLIEMGDAHGAALLVPFRILLVSLYDQAHLPR